MDAATKARIDTWLNGNYDEETKHQIKYLEQAQPEEMEDA